MKKVFHEDYWRREIKLFTVKNSHDVNFGLEKNRRKTKINQSTVRYMFYFFALPVHDKESKIGR